MDSHHLRAILVKLQDRLSDDDRKRLHFFLGNDVPRRIRDDPSLGGTLCLLESLFDQDKINEHNFTFLITAFDEIQCIDAVKLLRAHMKRMQSNNMNESVHSLLLILPSLTDELWQDQEDKFAVQNRLIDQENICGDNSNIVTSKNVSNIPLTVIVNNQAKSSSPPKQKQSLSLSSMTGKYVLSFVLLSIILAGAVIFFNVWIIHLKDKYNGVLNENTKNSQTIQHLTNKTEQLEEKLRAVQGRARGSGLVDAEAVPGFRGQNGPGIGSWFRANNSQDISNGRSWCGFDYYDTDNGFAPDISVMCQGQTCTYSSNEANWRKYGKQYCGLEAEVTNTKTGHTRKMYIIDAFDHKWVKKPGSINIMIDEFTKTAGFTPSNKNEVIEVTWKLTGKRNNYYAFSG